MTDKNKTGLNGQGSDQQGVSIQIYASEDAVTTESKYRTTNIVTKTENGTTMRPFLFEGGWFIVEADVTDLESVAFSIRGVVESKTMHDVMQKVNMVLNEFISGSKHSDNC